MKKGGKGSLMQYVAMSAVRATIIIACLFCAGRAGAGDLRSEVTKGPLKIIGVFERSWSACG